MNLENKVIVITGAGNGLGRELALQLLAKGNKVAGIDIKREDLDKTSELAGEFADNFSSHTVDVTNKEQVDALPSQVIEKHGQVDAVINNAGIIQPFVPVNDLDFEKIYKVMDVNFFGTLYMVKAFLPHLLKRQESHLVNVSSMGGFFPVPGQTIYGASKAAMKLLTEGLYTEMMNSSVNISLVLPGAMETEISKNSEVELTEKMKAMSGNAKSLPINKAAEIIINGVEKNKPKILVGRDARFMDFLYRIAPVYATKRFGKYMKKQILGE